MQPTENCHQFNLISHFQQNGAGYFSYPICIRLVSFSLDFAIFGIIFPYDRTHIFCAMHNANNTRTAGSQLFVLSTKGFLGGKSKSIGLALLHENCAREDLRFFAVAKSIEPTAFRLLPRILFAFDCHLSFVHTRPTKVKLAECCGWPIAIYHR